MIPTFIIIGIISLFIGVSCGIVTGLIIRHVNQKSVVTKPKEYTEDERKKLMANQEILIHGREDHSSKYYK